MAINAQVAQRRGKTGKHKPAISAPAWRAAPLPACHATRITPPACLLQHRPACLLHSAALPRQHGVAACEGIIKQWRMGNQAVMAQHRNSRRNEERAASRILLLRRAGLPPAA